MELGRQLCAGLAAAHEQGVLHRDLKPTNIMVDARGRIRIMDFRLAVPDDGANVVDPAGTVGYMAPEQLRGGPVTQQTDLFALGVVLKELFGGVPPSDVESVVESCLKHDSAERPESASAVLVALGAGDALAAALAQGRLPSPNAVAGAAIRGGLRPSIAWMLLAVTLATSLAVAKHAHELSIRPADLPKPPEVLAERAREILLGIGHVEPTTDSEYWFTPTEPIQFIYRQSADYLIPQNPLRVVTEFDPSP